MSQVLQLLAHFVLLLLKILQLLVLQLSRLGHFPHHQAHGDGELEGGVGRGGRDGGICVVAVKKVFDVVAVAAAVVIIGCYVVVVDVSAIFLVVVHGLRGTMILRRTRGGGISVVLEAQTALQAAGVAAPTTTATSAAIVATAASAEVIGGIENVFV